MCLHYYLKIKKRVEREGKMKVRWMITIQDLKKTGAEGQLDWTQDVGPRNAKRTRELEVDMMN